MTELKFKHALPLTLAWLDRVDGPCGGTDRHLDDLDRFGAAARVLLCNHLAANARAFAHGQVSEMAPIMATSRISPAT